MVRRKWLVVFSGYICSFRERCNKQLGEKRLDLSDAKSPSIWNGMPGHFAQATSDWLGYATRRFKVYERVQWYFRKLGQLVAGLPNPACKKSSLSTGSPALLEQSLVLAFLTTWIGSQLVDQTCASRKIISWLPVAQGSRIKGFEFIIIHKPCLCRLDQFQVVNI